MSDVTSLLQGNKLIEIDENGQIAQPILVLSSRGGNKIGVIKNVTNINVAHPLADVAELSFDVTKEINGEVYDDWDKIKDFKLIQMPYDNTWYEATVSIDEEDDIVKHVTCTHANEAELGQLNLYDTEINTEADIGRDDYEETVFYNEENPKASLLHRILKDKAPHYQIYHVDGSLRKIFRVFSFNGESIQDALNKIAEEVNCLFVYGEWNENDGEYHRTISAYDLEDYCTNCHTRGEYTNHVCTNCGSTDIIYGYGEDTGIFVSKENLAKSINYESNTDNLKNCFRLVAGDDVMTSAIKSCNPSMSQYIWHFSEDMLEDMSDELVSKITEYEELVESYKKDTEIDISSSFINSAYNALVDKYGDINEDLVKITTPIKGTVELTEAYYNVLNMYGFLKSEMMPSSEKVTDTTASDQLALLQGDEFTEVGIASVSGTIPYTTANSAIQSYAKVFIDTSRYKVSVFTSNINGTAWTGTITITSYRDDEDTATGTFAITLFDSTDGAKYADWLDQSVQKTMASREVTDVSVVNLFKKNETLASFKEKLKKYSLDYLNIMSGMATSAITVMSEQGVANQDSLDTDVYRDLYLPYLQKSRAIQDEIRVRENELSRLLQPTDDDGVVNPAYQSMGLLDIIIAKQDEIREILDLDTYLGDELWEELSFYRRESEYSNSNYVSDGLTDSEVIKQAQNFINVATKEIVKASTLQHTISASLSNFLLMDEFADLQKNFKVGNWIWLQADGKVYRLRLANWEIDYENIDDLEIEFTDVVRGGDIISDVESILSKSKSMATTYDYTARQADKGKDAATTVKFFKDTGIDFSKVKAITSKGNTNIVYDDDGILLTRVDVYDESPEQARIYNNGIYITRDAWETVSTGLGHFSYIDPKTGETVETYGIIADTVIGKLILGENLKLYSSSGRLEMGDDGLKVTAIDGENNSDLFVIQKQMLDSQGKTYVEKYIYVDSDGNVRIAGNSITLGGKPLVEYIEDTIGDIEVSAPKIATIIGDSVFKYNADGSVKGGITTITLTGRVDGVGIDISEWQYQQSDGSWATYPNSTADATLIVNESDSVFTNDKCVIRLLTTDNDVYDLHTIVKIRDGAAGTDTISAILTNEDQMIPISNGVADYSGATSRIIVYESGVDVTGDWSISLSYDSNNLTVTSSTTTTANDTVKIENMVGTTGTVEFTASKTGHAPILKQFTVIKVESGVDGKSPVVYSLEPSTFVLNKTIGSAPVFTPSSVRFYAYQTQDQTKSIYRGRFKIYENILAKDITSTTQAVYTSSSNESSGYHDYTPSNDCTSIVCVLYKSGGTTAKLDTQTVAVTMNGQDGGRWYSGTGITGTSATSAIFVNSGVSYAVIGDMYLNTNTYNTYYCTVGGNSSTARWVYVNNIKGKTGDTGKGIANIINQYYLSSSDEVQSDGTWTDAAPSYIDGYYYWTKSIINWTDGSTTETEPVLDNGLTSANVNAADARKVATNYLAVDNTGIMVADMKDGEQTPSGITSGKNVFIDSKSVQIRDGQNTLSSFGGNSVVLGQKSKSRLELSSTEISGISDAGVKNFNIINGDSDKERTITKNGIFENASSESTIFNGSFTVSDNFRYFHNITATIVFNYIWDGQQNTTNPLTLNINDPVEDETAVAWNIRETQYSSLYDIDKEINCYVQHDGDTTFLYFDASAELKSKTTSVSYEMENTATYSVVIETKVYQKTSYTFGSRVINSEHGANSFAIGEGLVASSDNQIAVGRYNDDDPTQNYAFMIGNGIYGESRSNAFAVNWNGRAEMGDINGHGLQLSENSQSEMDNYIECIDVNDDSVFNVSKTGAVNTVGRINAPNINLQKESASPTNYIQCQDENNTVKFGVFNDGSITTEGNINASGNVNISGLIQYNNKPMFKVVNKTFTSIGIGSGRAYTAARDIAIDGYKPMSIGGIKLTNNSAYNPSTNVDASWCVIPTFWLDYSTTIDHPNVQSDSIYFYIWNMHGSSGVNVDFHARIVYIATDALGNS